jgi:hypothetical protein
MFLSKGETPLSLALSTPNAKRHLALRGLLPTLYGLRAVRYFPFAIDPARRGGYIKAP